MRIQEERLFRRFGRIADRWHPALARSLREYAFSGRKSSRRTRNEPAPYWLLVPGWLKEKYLSTRGWGQSFLKDALRGQFCAFLAIKMHDDLFDGHVHDRSLILVADHLLLAARDAFAPHFSGETSFWSFFDSSVKRTLNAISAVDYCQIHGHSSPGAMRAMARDGYAVCNIAAYAVCLRSNRLPLFDAITRCTDDLAFTGQLLDDLEDMEADLERGRTNYAAYYLLGEAAPTRKNALQRIARNVIVDGSADRFFAMLDRRLRRADALAEKTGLPGLHDHVEAYRAGVESSQAWLHQKRVDLLFSAVSRKPNGKRR